MKYITTRDLINFCLSITNFLYFEGGHFDTKFDRKYARLMDQIWKSGNDVIVWNDDNRNILLINEVLLEDNGEIFDDYDHFLIDDPVIDPQEDGDLNIHDPDMWLDQLNGKNNSLHIYD